MYQPGQILWIIQYDGKKWLLQEAKIEDVADQDEKGSWLYYVAGMDKPVSVADLFVSKERAIKEIEKEYDSKIEEFKNRIKVLRKEKRQFLKEHS